ncbi:MAG TPA: ADP-ribosylglycohydrolase family protein [Tepidisphaeraceae bacterium]|jgi:poly(ADP-ribose) glycohydrolase ARH3|nr:ADP-ribosylglycohydrolase family protein [Tepidisphaeraceae bacterium]
MTASPSRIARFRGCLLGLAVGDALGAPFEGMPADAIYYSFGFGEKIVARPPLDALTYTDDTQMMIGVAEAILAEGRVDEDALALAFGENFEIGRGYGQGARRIIERIIAGGDWRELSRTIFPDGSLGNGAAMRAAPVGLFFHHDLDRAWDEAARSATPTHTHPVGIEGAQLIALSVALVCRDEPFDRGAFYGELLRRAKTREFQEQLKFAAGLGQADSLSRFGNSLEAHRSVVTAIACFSESHDDYAKAIGRAISLGGDTDTLAAMAGAISGAHLGIDAVPKHLLNMLENGDKGRDYIERLADNLARLK